MTRLNKIGRATRACGAMLVVPFAYAISRVGLEIARTSAGVGADTCTPVDAIAALACVGCAAYVAGSLGQVTFRATQRLRGTMLLVASLAVVTMAGHFNPCNVAGHGAALHFLRAGAWSGLAWTLIAGFGSGWWTSGSGGTARAGYMSLLVLLAVLTAFWAFVHTADEWLVHVYG